MSMLIFKSAVLARWQATPPKRRAAKTLRSDGYQIEFDRVHRVNTDGDLGVGLANEVLLEALIKEETQAKPMLVP